MAKVKLSSPWITFYHQIEALFKKDPEIEIVYDQDNNVIKLYVDNQIKADALTKLLPMEKTFGNVTIKINVIPSNKQESKLMLFQNAFYGNPAFSFADGIEGVMSNPIYYVVFKNEVVQYFNDNLGDIYGNNSTLYQDIAKNVFGDTENVCFCTDLPE